MPVRSTTYDNRRLPPTVSREWNNQSQVADTPNPNRGMEAYKRNNPPGIQGTHGVASAAGNPMNDPRAPLSIAGLEAAANATDQGYAAQYDKDNAAFTKFADAPLLDRGRRNGTGESRGVVGRTDISQAEQQRLGSQNRMNQTAVAIMNPEGRRFTQALMNAGVSDSVRTGATHGADPYQGSSFGLEATADTRHRDKPGFFDVQDHDYLAKLQRLDQLALSDYTRRSR